MRWLLVVATGCTLYTGGGGDDCKLIAAPAENVRDPSTGQCMVEGPCSGDIAQIEGPACGGPCENLGEGAASGEPRGGGGRGR